MSEETFKKSLELDAVISANGPFYRASQQIYKGLTLLRKARRENSQYLPEIMEAAKIHFSGLCEAVAELEKEVNK